MGTTFCTLCAGVLLLFSSLSRATEPLVDGKSCVLSYEDGKLSGALAFYAQGLYYLRETSTPDQLALAVDSFRFALALDSAELRTRKALVEALLLVGDVLGALHEQLILARMCPDRPVLWLEAYSLANRADDLDGLAEVLNAIEAVPEAAWQAEGIDTSYPVSMLVCGLARLGDLEKSHACFRAFIAAESLSDQADTADVISPLDCVLELAGILLKDQMSDEAFNAYLGALSDASGPAFERPQMLMRIADVFLQAEQPDIARARAFRLRALTCDPMAYSIAFLVVFPTTQFFEGLDLVAAADTVGAYTHASELAFPFSLLRLELLVAASSWDAAAAEWERLQAAKKRVPENSRLPEAYYLLGGMVLDHCGQTEELFELLNAGLSAYPKSHNLMNSAAYILAVEGRELTRALALIDRALVYAPEQYAYLDTLGWVLYKMGDYDGAFRSLYNALFYVREPNHELYDHMGDVLFKLGREAEASIWWAESYSLHPDPVVSEKLLSMGIDSEALP